jgi:iron complex outermembrane recepter protein
MAMGGRRNRMLWLAGSCASAIGAQWAWAPQAGAQTAATPSSSNVSEVIVTATRVQRSDFSAPTPTVVLTTADIEKTGAVDVGDIAAQIPAFQATNTPTTSVLSEDTGRGNFLDLRGLGPSRTLVLVDGERFVPTTPDGLLDTDVIPAAIIDHVDVVTGGASASWGSDAVSGVVNVILKRNLTGLQGDFQGGESQYGDNRSYKASLAFGADFDGGRGHFEIAGEASDNSGVAHQSDRPWSAQDWGLVQTPQFDNVQVPNARLSIASYGGLILSGPLAGSQFGPGGAVAPFQFGANVGSEYMQGGDGAVFAPNIALEVPLERQTFFGRASFDLTPKITAFADVSYSNAITNNAALVQNFDLVDTISTDNAFLPAAVRDQYLAAGQTSFALGRLDNDFGFIGSRDQNQVGRVVLGLDGSFGATWTWHAYYEFGRVQHDNSLSNVVNTNNYALSLDSVIDPASGAPVCRSTLTSPGNGCVPINIFGVGSPQAAAIQYVTGTEHTVTYNIQHVVSADIQGEPFSTWAGPVSLAAGAEYRYDAVNSNVDALQEAGDYLIGDGMSFSGHESVGEGFLETVVPLLSDLPLAKSLDLDLAARFTGYSISGYVTTWKVGVTYTVTDQLRFRATQSRDIRAPNLAELYQTGSLNFATITDPATGQDDLVRNPSPPNLQLKPEQANTTTFGVVYEPGWLHGFSVSVDYYDIDLKQVISQLNPQEVVDLCFQGDQSLCPLIQRDPTGAISEVDTPNLNLSEFHTNGIDLEVVGQVGLDEIAGGLKGDLTLRLLANYVDTFSTSDGVSPSVNEAGAVGAVNLPSNIGAAEGVPHWRGNLSGTYVNGPVTLYLEGRYVGGGKLDNLYTSTEFADNSSPARVYLDGSVQYTIYNADGHKVQLYGLVNNILNQSPPIIVDNFIAPLATNPSLYDVIGRTFILGARFQY